LSIRGPDLSGRMRPPYWPRRTPQVVHTLAVVSMIFAGVFGALVGSGAAAGGQQRPEHLEQRKQADIGRYDAMVDAYAAGRNAEGLDALALWHVSRVRDAAGKANSRDDPRRPWDERRYRLSVMLHTDVALLRDGGAGIDGDTAHLEIASRLLASGSRQHGGLRAFASRWYTAVSRALRDRSRTDVAPRLLALGREWLVKDAALLYESGTLAESLATDYAFAETVEAGSRRGPDLRKVLARRATHLAEAAEWLDEARILDPADELIRLHLGRVHALRLEDDQALRLLSDVLAQTKYDWTAYLAAMFIGAVHERQTHLQDAAAAYRVALSKVPRGHAANIGLSHVLTQLGSTAEAAGLLRKFVAPGVADPVDPRWDYHFEPSPLVAQRLYNLRAEARR
jgi:hypothetical protein